MIKTILVGLGDLDYSRSATQYAVELAQRHGARLTAVTFVDPSRLGSRAVPIGAAEAARELRAHQLKITRDIVDHSVKLFEDSCRLHSIDYEVAREEGNPIERMIMWSRYHDLILCGLRNLFDPGVIETPPIELVHFVEEGVRPLVAVAAHYREIQRVMIAYSGSTESAKSMKRFIQLRPWADTEVHLVTFDHDEEKARGRLSQAADYCRAHGVDPQLHHGSESPKTGLLEYATRIDADLIVLGNSARNFLLKRIFGETALYVVAHADRPLFLCQ